MCDVGWRHGEVLGLQFPGASRRWYDDTTFEGCDGPQLRPESNVASQSSTFVTAYWSAVESTLSTAFHPTFLPTHFTAHLTHCAAFTATNHTAQCTTIVPTDQSTVVASINSTRFLTHIPPNYST